MKRSVKHITKKALAPKRAKAKTPAIERGQNAAEVAEVSRSQKSVENESSRTAPEKLTAGQEQKKRMLSLPLAGQGRTVTSPTPLDE